MATIEQRAAEAATAVERLARAVSDSALLGSVAVAYVQRVLAAAAKVEDYSQRSLTEVEPNPNYLGPIHHSIGTSAERNP